MVHKSFYSLPWARIVACEEGGVLEEAAGTHDPIDTCELSMGMRIGEGKDIPV